MADCVERRDLRSLLPPQSATAPPRLFGHLRLAKDYDANSGFDLFLVIKSKPANAAPCKGFYLEFM